MADNDLKSACVQLTALKKMLRVPSPQAEITSSVSEDDPSLPSINTNTSLVHQQPRLPEYVSVSRLPPTTEQSYPNNTKQHDTEQLDVANLQVKQLKANDVPSDQSNDQHTEHSVAPDSQTQSDAENSELKGTLKVFKQNFHAKFSKTEDEDYFEKVKQHTQQALDIIKQKLEGDDLILYAAEYFVCFSTMGYGASRSQLSSLSRRRQLAVIYLDDHITILLKLWQKLKKYDVNIETIEEWKALEQKNPNCWAAVANIKKLLTLLVNTTDFCEEGVLQRASNQLVTFILSQLSLDIIKDVTIKDSYAMAKSYLGILFNFAQFADNTVEQIREQNGLEIVSFYCKSSVQIIQITAQMLMAYLLAENEDKAQIETSNSAMLFVIRMLSDAVVSVSRRSRGFRVEELLRGLNKLAASDKNKRKIVENGGLPLYAKALAKDKKCEQLEAARGLWTLAFDDENKTSILNYKECMEGLRRLAKTSEDDNIKKAANGALWKLEGEIEHIKKIDMTKSMASGRHIMLSYNWGVQPEIFKLRDRLRSLGYNIWIDIEQMSGSTLEAMSRAVERSAVILICYTEKYKYSSACRSEAEYCYKLNKEFIPIRMQYGYNPDGWLGMLLGTKFFYDLGKPEKYEKSFKDLVAVMGDRGKLTGNEDENDEEFHSEKPAVPYTDHELREANTATARSFVQPSLTFQYEKLLCLKWTNQDVINWLTENKLENYIDRFFSMNGELIAELLTISVVSPDIYYALMKDDLKVNMVDLCRFNRAIRKLTQQ